ncbi:MAG: arsenate reductase ArsC [Bacteroidetes bacterium]|nr:arsenate reductase ArsC [Bacteroidota bacterium]
METVLFVCTHNSARSQMAEGLLRARYGDRYRSLSAGTEPGGVNPFAVEAMRELGIDISSHRSEHVDAYINQPLDYVVTVCDSAKEACPYIPATRQNIHMNFPDPSAAVGSDEEKLNAFRTVRDAIAEWIDATFGLREQAQRDPAYPLRRSKYSC